MEVRTICIPRMINGLHLMSVVTHGNFDYLFLAGTSSKRISASEEVMWFESATLVPGHNWDEVLGNSMIILQTMPNKCK